jgi:hypothetical protein
MGFVLESEGNIGGEARSESFRIFAEDGDGFRDDIELEWKDLHDLIRIAGKLWRTHEGKHQDVEPKEAKFLGGY